MSGGAVPGGPGWRIYPCGRDTRCTIPTLGDCEPREPCSDKERRNRRDAPTVRRDATLGAVRVAQGLARRGELGIATVAMVVTCVTGGSDKSRRRTWEIQALAMAGQSELGPEQRRHRQEDGALEPATVATADHDLSLPLVRSDATDPGQSRARPRAWTGGVAFGVAGPVADLARRSALATTDTELRLIASAATIGLSRIPNAG